MAASLVSPHCFIKAEMIPRGSEILEGSDNAFHSAFSSLFPHLHGECHIGHLLRFVVPDLAFSGLMCGFSMCIISFY